MRHRVVAGIASAALDELAARLAEAAAASTGVAAGPGLGADPRADPGDIARRVQSGRPGRMLGVRERGGDYVVRWEYPGGRVSDIQVDGQSGRVRGDD